MLIANPAITMLRESHLGRSLSGHSLEDQCICPKQPCGLIAGDQIDRTCKQHRMWLAGVPALQHHLAADCTQAADAHRLGPVSHQPLV